MCKIRERIFNSRAQPPLLLLIPLDSPGPRLLPKHTCSFSRLPPALCSLSLLINTLNSHLLLSRALSSVRDRTHIRHEAIQRAQLRTFVVYRTTVPDRYRNILESSSLFRNSRSDVRSDEKERGGDETREEGEKR